MSYEFLNERAVIKAKNNLVKSNLISFFILYSVQKHKKYIITTYI